MLSERQLLAEMEVRGIRLTRQRRALVETIEAARGHLDAAALLKLARQREPDINRATVYRTLDLLKRLALIDELDLMHLEGEKHYYEAHPQRDHIHLTCIGCGQVVEFACPAFERLKQEIGEENHFDIKIIRLEVGGLCPRCLNEHRGRLLTSQRGATGPRHHKQPRTPARQ